MSLLIVYYARQWPMRNAVADHMYAFRRYSRQHCYYFNALNPHFPEFLKSKTWDAILFHNTFLIRRGNEDYHRMLECFSWVKDLSCSRVAIIQDEHNRTDMICDFIKQFNITHISCVCPTDKEVQTAFGGHIPPHIPLVRQLPGYAEPRSLTRIQKLLVRNKTRDIDIGYRSFRATARLGRLGVLKWKIADEVLKHAAKFGLKTDISVENQDTLLGDAWLDFLTRTRYQLGVEGGSSLIDRTGDILVCCHGYERKHPQAGFEEIEAACFPGQDGNFNYAMITSRVFESAMAGACMIMVEGYYNGILQPHIHYIPIKSDFSNIGEALSGLDDEERRRSLVKRSYDDLIVSGKYSYQRFVEDYIHRLNAFPERDAAPPWESIRCAWFNSMNNIHSFIRIKTPASKRLLKKVLCRKG